MRVLVLHGMVLAKLIVCMPLLSSFWTDGVGGGWGEGFLFLFFYVCFW